MTDELLSEVRDGALWLTLNRPETFNALSGEMTMGLITELRGAVSRDDVRAIVLTGIGDAFSAGADMAGDGAQERYDQRAVDAANMLITAITECDKPVLCALNGVAAGVGLSLVLACDLVLARESAVLTLAFTKLGLMPDGGASATLSAAVGRFRAMRLALLSDVVGAREALEAGLVSHVAADEEYDAAVAKLVSKLVAGPPLAFAATKKAINAATLPQLPGAFQRERAGQSVLLRSADFREGVSAFNEKRRATFTGE